ncbi:MAG TPA: hypothetical protein VMR65_09355 [Candidatus Sulfotelmatobacter sp.]|jgi:hypothetical protein|nr:hypothetical protein [Candidatus Sulfotelmatobacter sp.]
MSAAPERTPFLVVGGGGNTGGTELTCSLCGARFTHGTLVCTSCPLNAGCEVVKCPSCGFQTPRRSRLVDWAKRLLRPGVAE